MKQERKIERTFAKTIGNDRNEKKNQRRFAKTIGNDRNDFVKGARGKKGAS